MENQEILNNTNPSMVKIITEKDYPITTRWVLMAPLVMFVVNIVMLFFGYIAPKIILVMIATLIWTPIVRSQFHYTLGEKFLDIKQGVFSKKTRHLPYGVIQTVFVKQHLLERIFGIASLAIEDASNGGLGAKKKQGFFTLTSSRNQQQSIGGSGNTINIPGLRKQHAEELKTILLRKIQENPINDSQSGL